MKDFKIGDKIKIKSWKEMTKEFEHDSEDIYCDATFTKEMEYLCGREFIIQEISDYDNHKIIQEIDSFIISFDMIKLVKEKVPEIIMHYNVHDGRYYLYKGEKYLYDTQEEDKAIEMFRQFCFDLNMDYKYNK